MSATLVADLRRAAEPHQEFAEHRCDDCRPGLSCPARRALKDVADEADWLLITPREIPA